MDAIERIKNGENAMDILREEVLKIHAIQSSCFIDETIYDKEVGKYVTYYIDGYEQIKQAKIEKAILNLPRILSKSYCFKVNKIVSYNETFDEMNKKHKQSYFDYKEEIKKLFEENDKDGLLTEFLSHKNILLNVEFYVNYSQKDLDNITKPFIDFLFANLKENKNDNKVKKLYTEIIKSESKEEEIWFNIIILNDEDVQRSRIKTKALGVV